MPIYSIPTPVHVYGDLTLTGSHKILANSVRTSSIYEGDIPLSSKYLSISGTAVNSDKIDSLTSSQLLRSDIDDTKLGVLTISKDDPYPLRIDKNGAGGEVGIEFSSSGSLKKGHITSVDLQDSHIFYFGSNSINTEVVIDGSGSFKVGNNEVWHEGIFNPSDYSLSTHNHDSEYLGINSTAVNSEKLGNIAVDQFLIKDSQELVIDSQIVKVSGEIHAEQIGITNASGDPIWTLGIDSSDLIISGQGDMYIGEYKIWHEGNLTPGETGGGDVSNIPAGAVANGNFSITGDGNIYVGSSSGDGDITVRDGSGSNRIRIDGGSNDNIGNMNVLIQGNGNAEYKGTVKVNKLEVSSSSIVNNLNAEMIGGKREVQLAKNESIYEIGGYGVYSGCNVSQLDVPAMQVRVNEGVVYTNSGRRIVFSGNDTVSLATSSSTYDRIDVIYVRGSSGGSNEGRIRVATGVASSNPVEPDIPTDGVKLATVLIGQNKGSILDTYITDVREWKAVRQTDGDLYVKNTLYAYGDISSLSDSVSVSKPIKADGWSTTLTFSPGITEMTWEHSLGLESTTSYAIMLSCDSPEPHVYWTDKTSNSVIIRLDDECEHTVQVDAVIVVTSS